MAFNYFYGFPGEISSNYNHFIICPLIFTFWYHHTTTSDERCLKIMKWLFRHAQIWCADVMAKLFYSHVCFISAHLQLTVNVAHWHLYRALLNSANAKGVCPPRKSCSDCVDMDRYVNSLLNYSGTTSWCWWPSMSPVSRVHFNVIFLYVECMSAIIL